MSNIVGEIIVFIILEYLNIQGKGLKRGTDKIISNFVKIYYDEIMKVYRNNLDKIVKNETERIAKHISDIQIQVSFKDIIAKKMIFLHKE